MVVQRRVYMYKLGFCGGYSHFEFSSEGLNQRDLKTILLKLKNRHSRKARPRKCRRQSVSSMNWINSDLPDIVTEIILFANTTLGDAGTNHLHLLPSTLQHLDLSRCGLSSEGVKNICEYMATNTSIIRLLMWGNVFGDDGAEYVAEMLCQNQTLRSLGIGKNHYGPTGFHHLSRGLTQNDTLRTISIGNDASVGDDHMRMFCPGLAVNKGLEELELGLNCITNQGLGHIEVALRENYYLKTLEIDEPFVGTIDTGPGTAWDKIYCWTYLNRLNRRAVLLDQDLALSEWYEILLKCHNDGNLDAMNYFLRLKPDVIGRL